MLLILQSWTECLISKSVMGKSAFFNLVTQCMTWLCNRSSCWHYCLPHCQCTSNDKFVLDLWPHCCVAVHAPHTLLCCAQIHESHSVTVEWQREKVINVLTQWWLRCHLSNAIRGINVAFVIRKRLNCVTELVSSMKRQRSTFSFCSSRREEKNKEHVR